ncbi:hypothetical protein [Bradyrhizobium sp. CCBAU 11434]|uniref:hypothetical protein n=1 Tax=Bradyrhizobium sp. CCBAU 11434 TaxID=1630885 RepID=UPI002305346C|nr:hypothetical protein [Bradyrhizobium sp. CCBAU 11434]
MLKPGKQLDTKEFGEHLLTRGFAKWQLPERYEFIESIPKTSTGKFAKLKLRERFPD